jgi:hypothetical protein
MGTEIGLIKFPMPNFSQAFTNSKTILISWDYSKTGSKLEFANGLWFAIQALRVQQLISSIFRANPTLHINAFALNSSF